MHFLDGPPPSPPSPPGTGGRRYGAASLRKGRCPPAGPPCPRPCRPCQLRRWPGTRCCAVPFPAPRRALVVAAMPPSPSRTPTILRDETAAGQARGAAHGEGDQAWETCASPKPSALRCPPGRPPQQLGASRLSAPGAGGAPRAPGPEALRARLRRRPRLAALHILPRPRRPGAWVYQLSVPPMCRPVHQRAAFATAATPAVLILSVFSFSLCSALAVLAFFF